MELLVIRHAIAEDREVFAATHQDDALRPLTVKGRRRFAEAVRGLRTLVESIDVLATSALARAIQTGEIVAEAYDLTRATQLGELAPEADPASLPSWLRRHGARSMVAIVGHEPHLSRLVEYLLTRSPGRGFVSLKKGGACLLSFEKSAEPGRAELRWLLTAAQLRSMR
ncbi:MAG TPA: histidine phosphatase family protein [Anaeromyxobacter sp.]|nr:histidine phosphatase family protein [Anaeromyxobacter sp.]